MRRIPPNRSSTGEHWELAFAAALSRAGLAPLTIQTYPYFRNSASIFIKTHDLEGYWEKWVNGGR